MDRLANPKGDRVRFLMSAKFLPHNCYSVEQGVLDYRSRRVI
jgi:hypothetical protein